MHVDVNGTRLWFDVDGPALVPEGDLMRRRPTVVLLHCGPFSYDHSYFKPHFDWLGEQAQVVYLDLRGHGRSAPTEPDEWSLEQCADDVAAACDLLGIDKPVVVGHSMGAPIALLHAGRTPATPAAWSSSAASRDGTTRGSWPASGRSPATRWRRSRTSAMPAGR